MTTINESLTAKGYTPAALVPAAFGRKRTIDGIVIHHWGVLGQLHDDVVKFFTQGPGTTSAHFVVSAGRIDCLVSPEDAAWHSGNAAGNATTIGIECRPEATNEDYATVAELVRRLRDQYGPLPLSPHREWNATACPGVWDLAKIDRLAGSAAIAPQSTTITQPKEWDEMASKDEIKDAIREVTKEGYGIVDSVWYRPISGWNGAISAEARILGTDQAVNDIRALVAAQNAQIAGLVGALASVNKGEPFDQAKLLEGVKSAAETGVKDAIESITVTVQGDK
jgi:hypothetical protein